jgi:hypothetical protein
MEVQMGFLVGGAFHEGVRLAYRAVGADATALATDVMTVQVGGLIGAPAGFGEWRLAAAELSDHLALTTSWRGAGGKVAVVLVHGPTATRPGFRRVGAVAVSYGVGEGLATPATDPEALALIEAVTVQMKEKTEEWERLIQL